eukprot:351134-Chlamydomonas_euryale.AAC.11
MTASCSWRRLTSSAASSSSGRAAPPPAALPPSTPPLPYAAPLVLARGHWLPGSPPPLPPLPASLLPPPSSFPYVWNSSGSDKSDKSSRVSECTGGSAPAEGLGLMPPFLPRTDATAEPAFATTDHAPDAPPLAAAAPSGGAPDSDVPKALLDEKREKRDGTAGTCRGSVRNVAAGSASPPDGSRCISGAPAPASPPPLSPSSPSSPSAMAASAAWASSRARISASALRS